MRRSRSTKRTWPTTRGWRANEIVTACKRLERENWRRARWELQHRFSAMRLGSSLSAVAKPFQPQATSSSMLAAGLPHGPVGPAGPREDSPAAATIGTPVRRGSPVSHQASDEGETSPDTSIPGSASRRRRAQRGNKSRYSGSDSDDSHAPIVRRRKKDGFSNKIQIPEFGGKKGHPQDVASAFRQWARCITYYRDYYEDSYLMPLVVSSLTGDASDVFDWTRSLTPGDPQDLSALLQMLREHYCGSFTFREQRNMVENLRQGAQEDATDFMIRVGTSVSNLDKDWQGQLSQAELESLQYEVSLNGVRQEIRHVLDSEIARRGPLTPHQIMRRSRSTKRTWPTTRGWRAKALVPPLANRKHLARLPTINRASIRLQLSPRRWKSLKPRLTNARRPSRPKRVTLLRLSRPWMMMMGCTYPAT